MAPLRKFIIPPTKDLPGLPLEFLLLNLGEHIYIWHETLAGQKEGTKIVCSSWILQNRNQNLQMIGNLNSSVDNLQALKCRPFLGKLHNFCFEV
jgi:hypothetical protein